MSRAHERRLKVLERAAAPRALGHLSFTQSSADPAVYLDRDGRAFTAEQINSLSAAGWCCLIWTWQAAPELRTDQHIRLTWGDDAPTLPEG